MALWHPFRAKQVEKGREREKIKIIVPFRFYSTRNKKFQKNSKNIQNTIMASFQAKIDWKMPRKREYKNYRYVSFPSEA